MNFHNLKVYLFVFAAACLLGGSAVSATAQDNNWRPVSPQELAAKTSVVEPDADAEATFWEVRVDDSDPSEVAMNHYVRVKIFTEKGRDQFAKHDLVYYKGMRVKNVEARVTKPDGSVSYLKKEDVLEREIAKANGVKVKAKSFALPGLEPGSIVEYRYREVIDNGSATMRLIMQREIPIQTISYYVKPFAGTQNMYWQPFNVGDTKFEKDKSGFQRVTMNKVPAFHEEPDMIPADEARSWIYIWYANDNSSKPADFWKNISKNIYESSKSSLKPTDEVKRVTNEVIAGATTDDEKLHKIYDYCKTQIKNLTYSSNVSDEEWKKVRDSKSGGETLKLKMGSASDIDLLFGAMARAAGYDARIALSSNRNELFFNPRITNFDLMVNSSSIAVKVGEDWRFFSPAGYFTPYGMMRWLEEAEGAMITDPKELIFKEVPLSPSAKSVEKKTGKFKLLEDGTLEGEATIEFLGHRSELFKIINYKSSPSERENFLETTIKNNILGNAEVENASIENVTDPEKPFIYKFKIRVPNFASRTGKRLFFQPNVFERSAKPRFTANARKQDVFMDYPWTEQDDIQIELPAGFTLESADAPALIKDPQGIASHETKMSVTKDGKTLFYKRNFSFGNNGFIRFPATSYPAVKNLFEAFNKADTHQLTLRQGTPATPPAPASKDKE